MSVKSFLFDEKIQKDPPSGGANEYDTELTIIIVLWVIIGVLTLGIAVISIYIWILNRRYAAKKFRRDGRKGARKRYIKGNTTEGSAMGQTIGLGQTEAGTVGIPEYATIEFTPSGTIGCTPVAETVINKNKLVPIPVIVTAAQMPNKQSPPKK